MRCLQWVGREVLLVAELEDSVESQLRNASERLG